MPEYDYIVAGAGAAGLSLTLRLLRSEALRGKRLLLVDRAPKTANDRTWCFWEEGAGFFEPVVCREWGRLGFHGPNDGFSAALDVAPYRYKMLRGLDFYRHCFAEIAQDERVEALYGEIESIHEEGGQAVARVSGRESRADWAFDSRFDPERAKRPGVHYLLQHFKGYEVQTARPAFDPDLPTFMDFRLPQEGETRFVYVLPLTERRALVEFTVFSPALLPEEEYDRRLGDYFSGFLGLKPSDYETLHVEFGVIPMTDYAFPDAVQGRLVRIGTAGGQTKASTGYTFQRVQEHSAQIVRSLERTGSPVAEPLRRPARFRLYDSTLLNVMATGKCSAAEAFSGLFRRNPAQRVLRFLDERTSLAEDLRIMSSVPVGAFMRGFAEEAFQGKG